MWRLLLTAQSGSSAKYRDIVDIRGVVQAVTDQDAAALREHSGASNYSELVLLLLVVAVLRMLPRRGILGGFLGRTIKH
jgi:hypothetical protein